VAHEVRVPLFCAIDFELVTGKNRKKSALLEKTLDKMKNNVYNYSASKKYIRNREENLVNACISGDYKDFRFQTDVGYSGKKFK
jgi:hypothetical protein